VRRAWVRCVAIDLGRPDGIDAAPDALQPEPWREPGAKPPDVKFKVGELHSGLVLCLANHGTLSATQLAEMLGTSYQCAYKTMKKRPDVFEPRRDGLIMRWRLKDDA